MTGEEIVTPPRRTSVRRTTMTPMTSDLPDHLFTAIDHVGIAVPDLDEAIAFYRDSYGMTALNTAGGIVGSLLVGFLLLPKLGIERTLHLLTGLSLATGAVAWLQLAANPGRLLRWGVMVGVTALWALTPGMTGTRVPADLLADG